MKEDWKNIPTYENRYMVSSLGNVKSIININTVMLKPDFIKGYTSFRLTKNGKSKRYLAHQLVAMSFLGHKPCGHKLVVDHIDNDKTNNHFSNLQLITQRQNASKDRKGSDSKYVGVYLDNRDNKWFSSITINNKNVYLGRFENEYDAHLAYQKALNTIQAEAKIKEYL
jgi:hypothetical protein